MGRVLLNNLDAPAMESYLADLQIDKLTARTITDKSALRREIERAGQQGYYVLDQELEIGLRSLAVPIHGPDERTIVAAINIATNSSTVSKKRLLNEILPILRHAAQNIRGAIV
jgi:IclR family pca regulon transcriptional regulator